MLPLLQAISLGVLFYFSLPDSLGQLESSICFLDFSCRLSELCRLRTRQSGHHILRVSYKATSPNMEDVILYVV